MSKYELKWDLCQGVPFFFVDASVTQEVFRDLEARALSSYCPDPGMLELRKRISEWENSKGVPVDPETLIVTPGANHAFYIAVHAFMTSKTPIAVPEPYYFNHAMTLGLFGVPMIGIALDSSTLEPDLESANQAMKDGAKAIVVVSPNNPTGRVYSEDTLKGIVELAEQYDAWIFSDETYDRFTWAGSEHHSVAKIASKRNVNWVTCGSFSKRFGMPGWRVGWLNLSCDPSGKLTEEVIKLQDCSVICAPTAAQLLAIHMYEAQQEWSNQRLAEMEEANRIFREALSDLFPEVDQSNGAMYIMPNIGGSDRRTAELLAKNSGIHVLPCSMFGESGKGRLRISYGNVVPDRAQAAADALRKGLSEFSTG